MKNVKFINSKNVDKCNPMKKKMGRRFIDRC